MQELRLVAVSEDGSYLVLATAGRGTRFTLPVDDRLRAAVRGHFSRLGQFEIEVESPLRPKEIQARIRAGETAEEIAESAGIPVERVRWFEGPVLQEREYMAQQAQRVTVRRQGETTPAPPLGEMVEERLGRRGVDLEEVEWDSWKCEDSTWRVRLSFFDEGRPNAAEWIFDPRRRQVSPLDEVAAALSSQTLDESANAPVTPLVPRRPAMKIVSDSRPLPAGPRREEAAASRIIDPGRRPAVPSRWDQAGSAAEGVGFARFDQEYDQGVEADSPPTEDMGAVATATGVYLGDPVPEQQVAAPPARAPLPEPVAAPEPPAERAPAAAELQAPAAAEAAVRHAAPREPAGQAPAPEPAAPPARPTVPAPEAPAAETGPAITAPAAPAPEPRQDPGTAPRPVPAAPAPAPAPAARPAAAAYEPSGPPADQQRATVPAAAASTDGPQATPAKPAPAAATAPAEPAQVPAASAPVETPAPAPAARGGRRKPARGKRASVPSWDEIMFGARRPD